MNGEYYRNMFQYDHWANQSVIAALKKTGAPPFNALRLLSHILAAQKVWLTRLQKEDSSHLPIWPEYSLNECETLVEEMFQNWDMYFKNVSPGGLEENIFYRNSQGREFETKAGDILTHVIIHSGYHRGQIAMVLRQEGGEPAVTDFIAYVRI